MSSNDLPPADGTNSEAVNVHPGIQYAVEQIKDIATRPASDVLFIAGLAVFACIYFVKYGVQMIWSNFTIDVSTIGFLSSIIAATLLLFGGAIIRYAIHHQKISKIGELEKMNLELAETIRQRRHAAAVAATGSVHDIEDQTLSALKKRIETLESETNKRRGGA